MRPLPFQPEPTEKLQGRFHVAIDPPIDKESLLMGTAMPPQFLRQHTFDFECGLRMTVCRFDPSGEIRRPYLAITGYVNDDAPGHGPVASETRLNKKISMLVAVIAEHLTLLSGLDCGGLKLIGGYGDVIMVALPLGDSCG